ncbi:hypothetical protein AAFP30_27805 [Gordonia sp. CPCC 205515]
MITSGGVLTPAGQVLAAELYDPAVGTIKCWLADGVGSEMARFGGS